MWSAGVRVSLYALVFTVLTLLVSAIEPFGIDSAVSRQSRDVIYRAMAPAYDGFQTDTRQFDTPTDVLWLDDGVASASRPAREQIATVYVSENVIRDIRESPTASSDGWESWRPSYVAQAQLINDLATLHEIHASSGSAVPAGVEAEIAPPPAIFLDFIFLETGGTDAQAEEFELFETTVRAITKRADWDEASGCADSFDKLVCIKLAGGTPLIFAQGVNAREAPAQRILNDIAILAPVAYSGVRDAYPVSFETQDVAPPPGRGGSAAVTSSPKPTPASLLYVAWCMDNIKSCEWLEPEDGTSEEARLRHIVKTFQARPPAPMSLVWGSGVPDSFVGFERAIYGRDPVAVQTGWPYDKPIITPSRTAAPSGARPSPDQPECRLDVTIGSMFALLARKLFGKGSDVIQPCPYHVEVPYSSIASGRFDADVARRVFDRRVIVAGARFVNSGDWAASAVHGQVPGFHRHAMALDNLMTFHDGYLEAPARVSFVWDKQNLFEGLAQFIVIVTAALGQYWLNRRLIRMDATDDARRRRPSHWIVYVTMLLVAMLISFGAVGVFVYVLRLEPPNWIGHIVLVSTFMIYLMRDEFFDDVGSSIRAVKSSGPAFLALLHRCNRYLDLETVGFEKKCAPLAMKAEKERVVKKLYPARDSFEPE